MPSACWDRFRSGRYARRDARTKSAAAPQPGRVDRPAPGDTVPSELEAYRTLIVGACMDLRRQAEQHLSDLAGGEDEILEDILSATQYLTQMCNLVSVRFALPVLRASESDRLALRIIGWMHEAHP